ncbi:MULTISPECIES: hypothetical protein [Fischerella]|uniref:hypothetical protein n=1 Tax=Fischerella TaxID=1190 RepID=UPI0012FA3C77|nr:MULTISPECIES: hypothetical protein [Fischerella]MBD2429824.1 hypothetical protein [Fischerella sp. FACHB-380]
MASRGVQDCDPLTASLSTRLRVYGFVSRSWGREPPVLHADSPLTTVETCHGTSGTTTINQ